MNELDSAQAFAHAVTAASNRFSTEHEVPLEAASLMAQLSASLAEPCFKAGARAALGHGGESYMDYTLGMYIRLWETLAPRYNCPPKRFSNCASDIFEAIFNHVEEAYARHFAAKLKKQSSTGKV